MVGRVRCPAASCVLHWLYQVRAFRHPPLIVRPRILQNRFVDATMHLEERATGYQTCSVRGHSS
jgi:hypothetical protein